MAKIIAIATQKGGEGKTATAHTLTSWLVKNGYRTLAVDMDPQTNLTYIMGGDMGGRTVMGMLMRQCTAAETVQHTPDGDLIPADITLASADQMLPNTPAKPFRLREQLEPIRDAYDYIIIDCPPSLGTPTANALTAADWLLIPAQADVASLQGISQLRDSIDDCRRYTNNDLKVAGILMTRFGARTNFSKEIRRTLEETAAPALDTIVFETPIRESVAVKEARCARQSLFDYAPKATVTGDYAAAIKEIMERINS